MDEKKTRNDGRDPNDPAGYDPPAVEEVLDAREFAREIHYAGGVGSAGGAG
jgi:hypothetical protein